ncbi:MAG: leucine-rich repeat domain-containing protein, partial [Lachnospiraceae bacterium]|nr:leucine-rich repeat domain-containing protein [Lachnospiraceae bacterium]
NTNEPESVKKLPNTQVAKAPSQPTDAQIGFTSITLDEVTELASVSPISGIEKNSANSIRLMGANSANGNLFRIDTPVFNNPGDAVSPNEIEYAKSLDTTAPTDDVDWQKSRTFTGLSMNTTYYFFARVAPTESMDAGAPSEPVSITTKKGEDFGGWTDSETHLEYMFDLTGYDGTVSPNAVVRSEEIMPGSNINRIIDDVEIPSSFMFYDIEVKVTEIGSNAFHEVVDTNKLINPEKVTLPDTIEVIGNGAFRNTVISSINIPDSVKEIGERAFYSCGSLNSVEMGSGVEKIGEGTFLDCVALTRFTIGDNVSEIGKNAFSGCTGLGEVVFNSKLETIGEGAFNGCTNLDKVEFKKGLKNIGKNAFTDCRKLSEIVMPSTVAAVSGDLIDESPFYDCNDSMVIYCAKNPAGNLTGWGDKWNKHGDGGTGEVLFTTYWYEEDTNDPTTVTVYSPDATEPTAASPHITELVFSDDTKYFSGCISTEFLKKMFDEYDTVIIPDDNVAILNGDLTIPEGKTLDLQGDMSTENFHFDGYEGNVQYTQNTSLDYDRGTLFNSGNIQITGKLYTAGQILNIENQGGTTIDYSSTIKSVGLINIADNGQMSVFYSYTDASRNVTDPDEAVTLDIKDLTISSINGTLYTYGKNGTWTNDYSGNSEFTYGEDPLDAYIMEQTGITGLNKYSFEEGKFKFGSGTTSDHFGLKFTFYKDAPNNNSPKYRMSLNDSNGTQVKTVYNLGES